MANLDDQQHAESVRRSSCSGVTVDGPQQLEADVVFDRSLSSAFALKNSTCSSV
jgi:hypothetical protein